MKCGRNFKSVTRTTNLLENFLLWRWEKTLSGNV